MYPSVFWFFEWATRNRPIPQYRHQTYIALHEELTAVIKPRMKGESKSSFIIECRDSASTSLPILLTPTIYSPASFIRAKVLLKYLNEMGKDYTIHGLRFGGYMNLTYTRSI